MSDLTAEIEAHSIVHYYRTEINGIEEEIVEAIRNAERAETERCAKKAEEVYHFGPSTQCPDCGSDGQVLHWYMLGRKDAAAAIRKGDN